MRVARLKIDGFRGANSADIKLNPHSVLIGPNNSTAFCECRRTSHQV